MLVRKIEGVWTEWSGRNAELHSQSRDMDITVSAPVIDRLWSDAELADVGVKRVVLFTVPAGKVTVGAPTYEEDEAGVINQVYAVEDAPAPTPTIDDVVAERERRLSGGFDYDFGDARGIHHVGTTADDMAGWDEVTKVSSALIATSASATVINIVTNTGPVAVTAAEWQQVLLAAAAARQPIWQASFTLQAMTPIPADYADDLYWSAV